MLAAAIILLSFSGSVALSLAMDRHHRESLHATPGIGERRAWRVAGAAFWLASLIGCIVRWDVAPGIIVWVCCLPLSALPVALLLAFLPRRLVAIGVMSAATSALLSSSAIITGDLRDRFPFDHPTPARPAGTLYR